MTRAAPFEAHAERYERWFAEHRAAYLSELRTLRELVPRGGLGLEIGVGTGRFAEPLGLRVGIDPAASMLERARRRGLAVARGVAEALPFRDGAFDLALVVTTICFVDDPSALIREAARVLKPGGAIVIGLIDRTSALGQEYEARREQSPFYRDARFFSAGEVDGLFEDLGFGARTWLQTLREPPAHPTDVEPPRPGFGEGAFVAVRAVRAPVLP